VRTDRYRYTRNFFTDRVVLQPQYRDSRPFLVAITEAYEAGTLAPKLAEIYYGERPSEELYDVVKDPAQVINLANNPEYSTQLKTHRQLLKTWLAKGDIGAENEPDDELRMNGEETKWGIGVNPEYERIRKDSDGDGLSDTWERTNDRDPIDGKLLFTFDCGGWQTEGWKAKGKVTNIAGYQGYLDFDLLNGSAALIRDGLSLDSKNNQGSMVLCMRCSNDTNLTLSANGKKLGVLEIAAGTDYDEVRVPLNKRIWSGTIENLKIHFDSAKGTKVAIDCIRVEE